MHELCAWSEERLAQRHPRYAKIFRRLDSDARQRQETDSTDLDDDDPPPQRPITTPRTPRHIQKRLSPPPQLPAPPRPSADKSLLRVGTEDATETETTDGPVILENGDVDIWGMKPVEAINFLCAYVEIVLKEGRRQPRNLPSPPMSSSSSGDTSRNSTPGPTSSPFNKPSGSTSGRSEQPETTTSPAGDSQAPPPEMVVSPASSSPDSTHMMHVPRDSRTPIDSPVSNPRTPIHSLPPSPRLPHIVVMEADKKAQSHHLSKRFFCKSVPNVSLAAYLGRIHRYCHMATAVYLAAGLYIEKLSQDSNIKTGLRLRSPLRGFNEPDADHHENPIVQLTPRSVHRLLLAALRVSNKALSDLYWPHKRFADVGGVSQLELQRLEVSMCYLCDFKLQVTLGDLEAFVRRARVLGVEDEDVQQR